MTSLLFVLLALAVVAVAGEFVRAQCRRMLERPVPVVTGPQDAAAIRAVPRSLGD